MKPRDFRDLKNGDGVAFLGDCIGELDHENLLCFWLSFSSSPVVRLAGIASLLPADSLTVDAGDEI